MTKESLKVGMRVAFYCGDRRVGTITDINNGLVNVLGDSGNTWFDVHPKQLRRLRPKKKPVRVECKVMWITTAEGAVRPRAVDGFCWNSLIGKTGVMTFVEDSK